MGTWEVERQREHVTSKCRLGIPFKITFLKILIRATIAPAQWDCEEGETACRKTEANLYTKMRQVQNLTMLTMIVCLLQISDG